MNRPALVLASKVIPLSYGVVPSTVVFCVAFSPASIGSCALRQRDARITTSAARQAPRFDIFIVTHNKIESLLGTTSPLNKNAHQYGRSRDTVRVRMLQQSKPSGGPLRGFACQNCNLRLNCIDREP